jgi:two-component system, NtrC family, response regulator AtoC
MSSILERMGADDETASASMQAALAAVRVRVLAVWGESSSIYWLPAGQSVEVGRGQGCGLRIDHPSVSRRHLRVHASNPVEIEDLGSANGTRASGVLLRASQRVTVASNEPVQVGDALVFVHPPASGAPVARADWEQTLDAVAKSRLSVVLLGETGVGKNVAARRLHDRSSRARGPFVHLNCAAVPEALLEGELFGFDAGAFTGAARAKPGLVEAADRGTLFLDEVGNMALSTQAKLLTALESGELTRLGSVTPRKVDLRVVAATNADLERLVAEGRFRADLYFRLAGVTLAIPPLRQRPDVLAELGVRFLNEACAANGRAPLALGKDAIAKLQGYGWPGNIRELRNVIERIAVLARGPTVTAVDVPVSARPAQPAPRTLAEEVRELERARILDALDRCAGNQSRAAEMLGMPRRTFVTRLAELGLPRPRRARAPR